MAGYYSGSWDLGTIQCHWRETAPSTSGACIFFCDLLQSFFASKVEVHPEWWYFALALGHTAILTSAHRSSL